MNYYEVYLPNVRDIYTWESASDISVGTRVVVLFRGRKKAGVVVTKTNQKPDFKTQSMVDVWPDFALPGESIVFAKQIASSTFSRLPKVLSTMIPDSFLQKEHPEKRDIFYRMVKGAKDKVQSVTGNKQKEVIALFEQTEEVAEHGLLDVAAKATITGLVKKGLLERLEKGITPAFAGIEPRPSHDLNQEQLQVLDEIEQSLKPHVLWGVTGSGKTEVYKSFVKNRLAKQGGQVLLLVPEISLTPQLIAEFADLSEKPLSVWHSKLSAGEKTQEWARIVSGESEVIVGTRSAIMLPFHNVSCIIIDEEHEWTYKNDFAPRFWSHDVALARAKYKEQGTKKKEDIKVLFGSATPRLESLSMVQKGEWDISELPNRVHGGDMPVMSIVDLKNESKKGNYTALSETLIEQMKASIDNGKQVVLFLNKRGYAGSCQCRDCGSTMECPHCSYALKLHGQGDRARLICHVCGHMKRMPKKCPDCDANDFVFKGWGTQQVEELLQKHFPQWRVLRADRDTMTGKYDHEQMLKKFHNHEADVLLGTQMISKGLDFEKVDLVGILLADVGLHLPDFRSEERVFQLLLQVAGRAGRRGTKGHIVLQTFDPENQLFTSVQKYQTKPFYDQLMAGRKMLGFPPFGAVAKITFSEMDKTSGHTKAKQLYEYLKDKSDIEVSMAPAFFPRTHNKYHWHVFVRSQKRTAIESLLQEAPEELLGKIDINPVSLL